MMRAVLPRLALADLPGGPADVVLCATVHLAADLRRAHGEIQARAGRSLWQPLQGATLTQWLDHTLSAALLAGEIPAQAMPGRFLTPAQERLLWEAALLEDAAIGPLADLFDAEALVAAAMEADGLSLGWRIENAVTKATADDEEYQAFRRWQQSVAQRCRSQGWMTQAGAMSWRIDCLERGAGRLPQRCLIAGFTLPNPLLERVMATLVRRGVALFELDFATSEPVVLRHIAASDRSAECHAAAAWARDWRMRRPTARLRIAVADLPATRSCLEAALEAALHPQAVGAEWAALPRDYIFIDGQVLAEAEPVATALRLLGHVVNPRQVALAEFGTLLCGPGWAGDMSTADRRARLDVILRERLPARTTLELIVRTALSWLRQEDASVTHAYGMPHIAGIDGEEAADPLTNALLALRDAARQCSGRAVSSQWAARFAAWLEAFGWPGERPLLACERAACDAFAEVLASASLVDDIAGYVTADAVWRELRRHCRERRLPPLRDAQAGRPPVEVCPLTDALGGPLDGLWLMGLNEGVWPPLPRPNPLLPAAVQRALDIPSASAILLGEAAQTELALWQTSAAEVIFSWPRQMGERMLRPSPLLAGMLATVEPVCEENLLRPLVPEAPHIEWIDDARAPPVVAGERIGSGTALLAAQAACPAWAFYRYRLGATGLPTPTFLFDARARGALLHLALENFWRGREQADLVRLEATGTLPAELSRCIGQALAEFNRRAVEPLPPRLATLEADRLKSLLTRWMALEAARAPFRVLACEERHEVHIEGLPVRLVVDRVDALADGRLVILDYKSGRNVRVDSWGEGRLTEPQLPIYASWVYPDRPLAAVALAWVVSDVPGFVGIAEEGGLLPEVKGFDEQRRRYDPAKFPDWADVRRHWTEALGELAREIVTGVAAVTFTDEAALDYCEVRPLLRLAERRRQWETARETAGAGGMERCGQEEEGDGLP